MINTAPGSELTVVTYLKTYENGFFTVTPERRGVLVSNDGTTARILRIGKDGDFSGIITEIPEKDIIYIDSAVIGTDHELVVF